MHVMLENFYTDILVPMKEYLEISFIDECDFPKIEVCIIHRSEKEITPDETREIQDVFTLEDTPEKFEKCGKTYTFNHTFDHCIGDYFFYISGLDEDDNKERIFEGVITLRYTC